MNDFDPRPIGSDLGMAIQMIRDGLYEPAISAIESALELLPDDPFPRAQSEEGARVQFLIRVEDDLYERESTFVVPPLVGAQVLVAGQENGWSEEVKRVWFDVVPGITTVELRDVVDSHDEGLGQCLLGAGWRRFGDE